MNRSGSVIIFKSLIFVLIFFILLFHISCVLRPSITIEGNNEKLGMLGYYAEPKNTIDVLYFGSSDATAFWIPFKAYEQAGFTSYTYGKSMMRASMFEDMLDEALKTQSPSLVIISLRTILQSGDTVEEAALRSVSDALPYSTINRWKLIFRNRGKIVPAGNLIENGGTGEPDTGLFAEVPYYFDIMKYHDNWQNIWEGSYHYRSIGEFESGTKGYFVRTGIQPQKRDGTIPKIQKTTELSSSAETALKSLIRKADENGFDLLFVMPPYCETAQDRMLFNRAAEIISASGYTAIDFNEMYDEIGIDELNDYYDPGHTNVIGAGKYTEYLAGYLSSRYGLEKHLSGQDRSNWDQGLELWKAEEKEAIRNCLSKRKTIFDF